jgi:hypothetical protein
MKAETKRLHLTAEYQSAMMFYEKTGKEYYKIKADKKKKELSRIERIKRNKTTKKAAYQNSRRGGRK